jgi:hypothetical protein
MLTLSMIGGSAVVSSRVPSSPSAKVMAPISALALASWIAARSVQTPPPVAHTPSSVASAASPRSVTTRVPGSSPAPPAGVPAVAETAGVALLVAGWVAVGETAPGVLVADAGGSVALGSVAGPVVAEAGATVVGSAGSCVSGAVGLAPPGAFGSARVAVGVAGVASGLAVSEAAGTGVRLPPLGVGEGGARQPLSKPATTREAAANTRREWNMRRRIGLLLRIG